MAVMWAAQRRRASCRVGPARLSRSKRPGSLPRSRRLTRTSSVSVSGQDADRRQQASAANAQMALQDSQMKMQAALDRAASSRADIAAQASLGAQLRGADDAMRKAPLTVLGSQIDMFSGLPLALFKGHVEDSTGTNNSSMKESGITWAEYMNAASNAARAVAAGGA